VDAAISGEVVSKGQFAALRNVSPGRVSQWISEGKIKPDALVGEGRKAKINVAVATRQLRDSLDVGQLTGNGVGTRLDLPLPALPLPAPAIREPASSPPGDPIADAIKQERLDQLRRANRREAEEEAARSGKYTDAAEAARQMGVIATKMMAVMEESLGELATTVSAKFEIPQRDMLHLLRAEFRKVRATAAKHSATWRPSCLRSSLPSCLTSTRTSLRSRPLSPQRRRKSGPSGTAAMTGRTSHHSSRGNT